jgi:hypothetical protein
MPDQATRQAIERAARANGIDPAVAMAIAERESSFNPRARSSKTIEGLFQMRGDNRRQYGVPDNADPETQANGWGQFFADNKGEMARVLGRSPTDAEGYLGHHFGSVRAARMMKMDPATPVDQVFTANERAQNPHFDKAGTVGNLNSTVLADIGQRAAKYGADQLPDFADAGTPLASGAPDLSSLGTLAGQPQQSASAPPSAPDLSQYGTAAT